jgi:hypothetical protein
MANRMKSFGAGRWQELSVLEDSFPGGRRRLSAAPAIRSALKGGVGLAAGIVAAVVLLGILAVPSWGSEPTAALSFLVLKEDNGKPVRNAAVVLHPVNAKGKQGRGGFELKTDSDGKTQFEGVPYGKMRVQVLAPGFQTYGEDFDIEEPQKEITIRLKRPQKQFSIYEDTQGTPKKDPPPQEKKSEEKK